MEAAGVLCRGTPVCGYSESLGTACYEMYLLVFVSLYISHVSVSKSVNAKAKQLTFEHSERAVTWSI